MRRVPIEVIRGFPTPCARWCGTAVWTTGRLTARWRAPRLPRDRRAEGRDDGALRLPPLAPGDQWAVLEGGQLLRPALDAGRGLVPRPVPAADERDTLVGEASPSYLFHPLAPERVLSLVPDVALVVLLREPADRAYSHYQHEVALGREPLSFEDALAAEDERLQGEVERLRADPKDFSFAWWNQTYRRARPLRRPARALARSFPREQLLVVTTEELGARPGGTYA